MPVHFVDPLAISGKFFEDLFRFTIAISVVIDPIGSVPCSLLTQKIEKVERASVIKTAIIIAAGLLFIFAVAGTQLLSILTSPLPALWSPAASCFS